VVVPILFAMTPKFQALWYLGNRSESLLELTISALKNDPLHLTVPAYSCATRHLNILFDISSHSSS